MTVAKDVAVETDLAIRRLVARYCQLVDDRDLDAVAALFTEDGRFRILDQDLRGREAIKAWLETVPDPMYHHVANVVVSNGSQPGTYHAVSDLNAGGKTDGKWSIWMIGRYHDTFAGEGREMRFTQRIVTSR